MAFYERYVKACEQKGIDPCSQKAADTLGVSRSTISQWGKRNNVPNGNVVAAIADMLDVSADYLLGRTDNPQYRVIRRDNGRMFSPVSTLEMRPFFISAEGGDNVDSFQDNENEEEIIKVLAGFSKAFDESKQDTAGTPKNTAPKRMVDNLGGISTARGLTARDGKNAPEIISKESLRKSRTTRHQDSIRLRTQYQKLDKSDRAKVEGFISGLLASDKYNHD